ncbi:sorting nexin-29 [Condylostylus longicornis]|uniref:sorting nexin-29 n=1 Tax=Condylostylus longicornis TaxID=2530218 RepID=UPI00244E57A2|nr:sorting nexin-29 [Condylostylus longicornis]
MNSSIETDVLTKLIDVVRLCQTKYSNKKELATENDELILKLCNLWEDIFNSGLRLKPISDFSDLVKSVQDVVSGTVTQSFSFWDFCKKHLSKHERERFENLRNISTKDGKIRALIRASLNEHSLQRYICTWLSDSTLKDIYEPNAPMINSEVTNLLPNLADGLSTIIFAINIDCKSLNIGRTQILEEPVIYAPTPSTTNKKAPAIERDILSFEDDIDVQDAVKILDSINDAYKINYNGESDSYEVKADNNLIQDTSINCDKFSIENSENAQSGKTTKIKDYLHSLGGQIFYEGDSSEKEYFESESSSDLSKSASYSGINISVSHTSSNVSGKNEQEKIKNLEEQLKIMTDRCKFLESRVAELSLENHRLQKLKNYIDNDFGNFSVTIPKVKLVTERSSKHYIYEIHIISREQESWIISKRYSDFYKLYQNMLKKHNHLVKTIDFPPKKKLGNMNASFIEERRQRLQMFLRSLLKVLPEINLCTSKEELEGAVPFFQ